MKMISLKNIATSMVTALVLGCDSGKALEERVNDNETVALAEDASTPKTPSDDAPNNKWYHCPEQRVEDCAEESDSWEIITEPDEPEQVVPPNYPHTVEKCAIGAPSYFPDGTKILYWAACLINIDYGYESDSKWGFERLMTIDLESGEKTTILDEHNSTSSERFGCPRWSPTAEYIALAGSRQISDVSRGIGSHDELALIRPNSIDFKVIAGQQAASDYECDPGQIIDRLYCPSWSPDGTRLVVKRQNSESRIEIYSLNGDRVIVPNPSCEDIGTVEWGKDNNIYFSKYNRQYGDEEDGLFVIDPDNLAVTKVSKLINDFYYHAFLLSSDATRALYFNETINRTSCDSIFPDFWCPSAILDLCSGETHIEDNICSKEIESGCTGLWLTTFSWHPFHNVIAGIDLSGNLISYKLPCSLVFPVPPPQPPLE